MSYQDICYQRLINLHQPGGESTLFDPDNLDKKLSIKFTKGGLYTDKTYLEGRINNLKLDSTAVAAPNCFMPGCVAGGGLWTTAITSDISRNNGGTTEYWIEGSLDVEGNLWVLDLGIINQATGDFIIKDKSVSIASDGKFKSRITLSESTKIAILKKVTTTTAVTVLHYIGQYRSKQKLSRTRVGYLLNYNAIDQQTDLELLSLGLLPLLFSTYKDTEPNTTIFYTKGELDYKTKQIIEDNLNVLSGLLDFKSTSKRINSIPKTLTTYVNSSLLYEDSTYLDNLVSCVETDCIDSDCIESKEVYLTSPREVSTRAVAWFYILVYTYTVYFSSDKYTYLLDLIAFYLENQISANYSLPSKGWTHADILADSTEILTYNLSTAVVTYIALMKHYSYSVDAKYLKLAADIEEALWSQLYNFKDYKFYNSISDSALNVEELSYGMLFATITNKSDVVEKLVRLVENNLTVDYGIIKESLVGSQVVLTNKLDTINLLNTTSNLNFTTLSYDSSNLIYLSLSNLLLSSSLEKASKANYYVNLKLQEYLTTFNNTLSNVEQTNHFLYITECVSENNIFDLELLSTDRFSLTSNVSFEKNLQLNKLIGSIPVEFSWFSKKALTLSSNLYKLLNSFNKLISVFAVHSKNVITNNFVDSLSEYKLNLYLDSVQTARLPQETDKDVRTYLSSIWQDNQALYTYKEVSRVFNRHQLVFTIKDNFKYILKENSNLSTSTLLGKEYYSGENYSSTNIVTITTQQPIANQISKLISKALPISTKPLLEEIISLKEVFNEDFSCTKVNLVTNTSANYLLLEPIYIYNFIAQESLDPILQENEFNTELENNNSTVDSNEYSLKLEDNFKFILE